MPVLIEFLGMQRAVTGETTVSDALDYIRQKYPRLRLDEGTVIVTVNQEIASRDRLLKAGDTISFLPFISGG
jgi:molybdopterin converting factor small subunit